MNTNDKVGWLGLGALLLTVWAAGCTDPNACQTDGDCQTGEFCSEKGCVERPGGPGDTGAGATDTGGVDVAEAGEDTATPDVEESDASDAPDAADAPMEGDADGGADTDTGPRYVDLSTGDKHSCGLLADGRVICWGEPAEVVDNVPTDRRFAEIDSGADVVCGRTTDDELVCWGTTRRSTRGVRALEPDLPTEIAGRGFDLGVFIDRSFYPQICVQGTPGEGRATCYVVGQDENFQLNIGSTIAAIGSGVSYACLSGQGGFACSDTFDVPLGHRGFTPPANPVEVDCSRDYCCTVDPQGSSIGCFGLDTDAGESLAPPSGQFDRIATGYSYACARRVSDQSVVCWGPEGNSVMEAWQMQYASDPPTVSRLAGTRSHVCGLTEPDGSIDCWGSNSAGQSDAIEPQVAAARLDGR